LTAFASIEDEREENVTKDTLFDGDVICFQAVDGYRFSVDSVLLAHFVDVQKKDRILDLGTGCGIIPLILLYRWGDQMSEIVGVELQHNLANLARKNLRINGDTHTCNIIEGDIKNQASLVVPESFDIIVCNPPFFSQGSGRRNSNLEARLARHQILATLDDFLAAASFAVRNRGAVYFIYPAGGIGTFLALLDRHRLVAKKLQFVYSYPQTPDKARLVLIECSKNGGSGAKVLEPLYIYNKRNGDFSNQMMNFYKKRSN